MIADLLHSN